MTTLLINGVAARRNGRPIFEPVQLEVSEPAAVEVVGPNGAGKTTLLRTLAGLYQQYDGSFELPPVLYQGHRLGLDELDTVAENLLWHGNLEADGVSEKAIRRALSKVGLLRAGMTQVAKLSQGQQRRACMARWLLSEKTVWLLDEPLTALDTDGQALLAALIDAQVAKGRWVIYSSHVPLDVQAKVTLDVRPLQ